MIPEDQRQLFEGTQGWKFMALGCCPACGDLLGGRGLVPLGDDGELFISPLACYGCDYSGDAIEVSELMPEVGLGIVWASY